MPAKELFENLPPRALEAPNPQRLQFELFWAVTAFLDEATSQGLQVSCDAGGRYFWHWQDRDRTSDRGFWALGEALRDAFAFRYPELYTHPDTLPEGPRQRIRSV